MNKFKKKKVVQKGIYEQKEEKNDDSIPLAYVMEKMKKHKKFMRKRKKNGRIMFLMHLVRRRQRKIGS